MTSRYEDVFEEALATVRRGADLDTVVARHPEYAARLREDLSVVLAARTLRDELPAPDANVAWARLQRDLITAREARAGHASRRVPFWRAWIPAAAMAAALAIVAFVAIGFLGGSTGTEEASAATFEGIVLDNVDGTLTLQTGNGLETVTLDATATLDDSGSPLQASSIEAGQMVLIRGQRLEAGGIVAARLELRAEDAMQRWCAENPLACREVDRLLNERVERCQQSAIACERIRNRLRDLTRDLPQITRLDEIRNRCEQADNTACVELRGFCERQPGICEAVRDGIVKRVTDGDAQRLRNLSQSCLSGEALACRHLREACQQQNLACPTPIIQRPISTQEPSRPVLQPTTPSRPLPTPTPIRSR